MTGWTSRESGVGSDTPAYKKFNASTEIQSDQDQLPLETNQTGLLQVNWSLQTPSDSTELRTQL